MWLEHEFDFFFTTCESNQEKSVILRFQLPTFHVPIAFLPFASATAFPPGQATFNAADVARLEVLVQANQLEILSDADREVRWRNRTEIFDQPERLPFVLSSIDRHDPLQAAKVPLTLRSFPPLPPTDALTLLDTRYTDPVVGGYAVSHLESLRGGEILFFLLKLVQALKYELCDDSPLAHFLIRRGLRERTFLHARQRFSAFLTNFVSGFVPHVNSSYRGSSPSLLAHLRNYKWCLIGGLHSILRLSVVFDRKSARQAFA
jgi:hypothetical protein